MLSDEFETRFLAEIALGLLALDNEGPSENIVA
jgi:hypothetical protein